MSIKARPAETAGAAVGTGGIIAALAEHNWLALGIAAGGYIPAIVTFWKVHHGLRGLLDLVWKGGTLP